jgi:hypothetical protein
VQVLAGRYLQHYGRELPPAVLPSSLHRHFSFGVLFCHPMLTVLAVTVLRWGLWSISYFDFIFGYCMEGMIQVAVATLWKVKAACEILISLSPGKLIFRCWENKVVVVYLVQLQILENMFLGVSYEKAAVSL